MTVDTTAPTQPAPPASQSTKPSGDVILLRVKRRREEPAPELLYVEAASDAGGSGSGRKKRGRLAGLVEGMAALGSQEQQAQQKQQRRLFAFARVGTLTAAAAAEADAGRGATVGSGGGGKRQRGVAAAGSAYREVRRLRCVGGQSGQGKGKGEGQGPRRTHIIELARPATLLEEAASRRAQAQAGEEKRWQQQQEPQRRPHYIFRPLERELDEAIGAWMRASRSMDRREAEPLTYIHTYIHAHQAPRWWAGRGTARWRAYWRA